MNRNQSELNEAGQSRTRLRELGSRVFTELDKENIVRIGFLPRVFLDEFLSGCFFLIDILSSCSAQELENLKRSAKTPDCECFMHLQATCRRLCQVSREIVFSTDGDVVSAALVEAVEELFRFSADIFPATQDLELIEYRDHIKTRKLRPVVEEAYAR
jgi:hypothetical protein